MTRALETAHLIANALDAPVQVDLNLREWLPDESYSWTSADEVAAAYADMVAHAGQRPHDHDLRWEPLDVLRERAMVALGPYWSGGFRVVAVCHEVLIHAVTGCQRTPHGGLRTVPTD